jgi:hypothetical protein
MTTPLKKPLTGKQGELSPELWHKAWIHFGDRGLKQCGNGIHPANEFCGKCLPKLIHGKRGEGR